MQVTPKTPHSAPACRSQLPLSPCYLVRCGSGEGLQWLAGAKGEWQLSDGRPAIAAIAEAAGVSGTHVFRLKAAPAMPPGNMTMARIVKIAAQAYGISQSTAQDQLFWLFDPDSPRDVRRLTGYMQNVTTGSR